MADVERSFGNKTTWDVPFEEHFRHFVLEANTAVFDSGVTCRSISCDALETLGEYDLVYIDPPYVNQKGVGVDYLGFYHFLEGLIDYSNWKEKIDYRKKHRPLKGIKQDWTNRKINRNAFEKLFQKYANSILVVSYRSDGIPSEQELIDLLSQVKRNVRSFHFGEYKYVLSTNGNSGEILLIGY
jgi:adenine-specific DNA methylase